MAPIKGLCDVLPAPSTISSEAGNGLVVDRDVAPGEPIVRILEPFLRVLDSPRLVDTCESCIYCLTNELGERRAISLSKCGGCGVVRYCSEVSMFILFLGRISVELRCASCIPKTGGSRSPWEHLGDRHGSFQRLSYSHFIYLS